MFPISGIRVKFRPIGMDECVEDPENFWYDIKLNMY